MMAATALTEPFIGDNATPTSAREQLARALAAADLTGTAATCTRPIRLSGSRTIVHTATGEVLHRTGSGDFDRDIAVSCRNRRVSACPACSRLYQYDAYNLIAAGLRGGKNTPAEVAAHPRLFVTLTAPSFGPVHLGPDKHGRLRPCHPRRDGPSCRTWHRADDPAIGTPIDPGTYDYAGHVLFNALAGTLWSRFTTAVRRTLAESGGLSRAEFTASATVAFAKVAEYQTRGVVHFHAVIRLDGPGGETPPPWATLERLEQAVRHAAASTTVTTPASAAVPSRTFGWGAQIDIRPIGGEVEDFGGMSDGAVARYIAKYATKSTESAGVNLRPLRCRSCVTTDVGNQRSRGICRDCHGTGRRPDAAFDLDGLPPHARALIDTSWRLGGIAEFAELKLRRWAHMLGFRGHFATKSRSYSTTFAALRSERAEFRAAQVLDALGLDGDTVTVIDHWRYAGASHPTPAGECAVSEPDTIEESQIPVSAGPAGGSR